MSDANPRPLQIGVAEKRISPKILHPRLASTSTCGHPRQPESLLFSSSEGSTPTNHPACSRPVIGIRASAAFWVNRLTTIAGRFPDTFTSTANVSSVGTKW
jgi:hypothetical protein